MSDEQPKVETDVWTIEAPGMPIVKLTREQLLERYPDGRVEVPAGGTLTTPWIPFRRDR